MSKINLMKNNPRILLYWGYKIINLLKRNTLNNGERYDPNILRRFNINDSHQEQRYQLAADLIAGNDTVLDIACGTGYGTLMLAEKSLDIKGVDISREAIKYANKHYKTRSNINFIQSDLFSFNGPADVVVSFETIEHVHEEIKDIVSKLIALTNKRLICSLPYREIAGGNRHHFHFNIGESSFDFLKDSYQVKFLYQSMDGRILDSVADDTATLIIIIDKAVN